MNTPDVRPFVYTEIDSRWARPMDRVRTLRLVWAVCGEPDVPARARRWGRWRIVRYVLNPTARVSWYVWNRGGSS